MPEVMVNGARIHYEERGQGPEAILFSHGLLWSGRMFRAQMAALSDRYRCVSFDFRGQGESGVTAGGYDMDTLTEDAAELIAALGLAPCHFAGLSMGGFIGMRLAARHPDLLRSLILMETSADPEPEVNIPKYRQLLMVARWVGLGPVAGRVMPIMFGATFMRDPARAKERREWQGYLAANNRIGIIRATEGVITREPIYDELGAINLPTLIIIGDEDTATTPDHSARMRDAIKGAQLAPIPRAGHTSSVEEPAAVTAAIEAFLASLPRT